MGSLNCVVFNEPSSEEPSSVEICRLKSGLNASCLIKLFDYLDINDLIQVCNVDKYFEALIMKWTIKKKTISIHFGLSKDRDDRIVQIFQKFGKSMRKLNLGGFDDFSLCLKMIIEYCEPATLTDIQIVTDSIHCDVNPNVMQLVHQSMPFFANLQTLILLEHFGDEDNVIYTEFLTSISTTATNLQKLELRQAPLKLEWLNNMKHLNELLIITDCTSSYDLDNCWSLNPKLKVFKFAGHQDITTVGDALSNCFTGLTEFSDINLENPYNQFGAAMIERYNFLSTFLHLNSVTLTSYTVCGCDLYYPLVTLATKNIKTLNVYMNYDRPIVLSEKERNEIMRRPLPHFFYLQTVEIRLAKDKYLVEDKSSDCDLRCQFMFHFVSQLKNLQCVKFRGRFLVNLYKILEHVPKLRTLHIAAYIELCEIQNIGKTLRKLRKSNDGDSLNLILNDCFSILTAHTAELHKMKDIVKLSFEGPMIHTFLTHLIREITPMNNE